MSASEQGRDAALAKDTDFDALVVGAGFSGIYMLKKLRDDLGLSVQGLEMADDVGGTWYHNKYPGARCDSDSWLYCYDWCDDVQEEWEWTERYPHQPEIQDYISFVAESHDLYKDIEFETKVTSATFDEDSGIWEIETEDGSSYTTQYFIPAVGNLSKPFIPDFDGLEDFEGTWYHTSSWPADGVDMEGKTVGLIGTGSTGIQTMPHLAEESEHLKVFQRTPNWAVPARNRPLEEEEWQELKANYDELWEAARNSDGGLDIEFTHPTADDLSREEAWESLEERWEEGGPLLSVFEDTLINKDTNTLVCEFIAEKIRETIDDPELAEKLIPMDEDGNPEHWYAAKRPPLAYNGYYERFNRDDVELVDVGDNPIARFNADSIVLEDGTEHQIDVLCMATGFDAVTGTLESLNITGRNGQNLEDKWEAGPRTYLGLGTHGFPNMFMITGPQSPSVLTNMVVPIQQHVEWITECLDYMLENGYQHIEAQEDAEEEWAAHNEEVASQTLYPDSASWYRGDNIPGKDQTFLIYPGGINLYNDRIEAVAAENYEGFTLAEAEESQAAD
ncbi:flavin-containing monooxygenase [Halorarius litoreus]|uniref:flavin-containing monooxygenase n=1 Tax=Halorarius litoreus TaxID=2962676 RepID=UPI0020CC143B|nr:NAD(P)/FAD-dependent oxidoreductase [Halorarius litoreus]